MKLNTKLDTQEERIIKLARDIFIQIITSDLGPEYTMRKCLYKAEKAIKVLDNYELNKED